MNSIYVAMYRFPIFLLALLFCGCADTGSGKKGGARVSSIDYSELDALQGEWKITHNEPGSDSDFEFTKDDVYTIIRKNGNKYYLSVGNKMYDRPAWDQHKNKKYKLDIVDRTGATDYLCANGIKLKGHQSNNSEEKHVIAFVAKSDRSRQLIRGNHEDVGRCESITVLGYHGGLAHGQN